MKAVGTSRSRDARGEPARQGAERSLVWLRLAVVLSALVPVVFFGAVAWLGYLESIEEARGRLDYLARAAQEHAARAMERNDLVLQEMARLLKDDSDAQVRAREAQLHEVATAMLLRLPHIRSLSVWSPEGRLLVSTLLFPVPRSLALADWQYFGWGDAAANGALDRGLYTDRTTGELLLRVTRRRELSTGESRGAIELTMSASYFSEFYRRLTEDESRVTVALLNTEGAVVGSWPPISAFSRDDKRYSSLHPIADHPLSVAVAQDAAAVFADWKRQTLLLGAILLPTTLALVFASWLVLRRTRREMEARRRLNEESRQRRRAEEALRHAQKLDALGQLAGGVAHDFNNLLMVVSNSVELLRHQVPEAAQRPELASIMRAADGGAKLTRRLLAFSRSQALQPEIVRLQAAVASMLDLLRTTAGKAISINLHIDPDTPAIEVDAAELEMALINLVANARDAMHRAGRLEIHARRAQRGEGPDRHPPGYAVISVSDNGQGMSAEILDRVFEPFFTTKPAGSGTGLGLSQVYGFCVQAGGDVEIDTTLHVGTTVSMFLPATPKAAAAPEAAARAMPTVSARVLLVEDNRDLSSTIASALEKSGCVVTAAASAYEAERLVLAEGRQFDVVLSDIVMPGARDGVALAKNLRQRKPELPVVLMTGYSREIGDAVATGFEVLTKPCPADEIIAALSNAVRRAAGPMH